MTPTPSDPSGERSFVTLSEVRDDVLRRPGLRGVELRTELSDAYDGWLSALLQPSEGIALVAVGGLGRREPAPYSDLDLVLLHDGPVPGLGDIADAIWYPVWDSNVGLDHSVRTPEQAIAVAREDLKAMLGLLDVRHVAGDAGLTAQVRAGVLEAWRAGAGKRLGEMRETFRERWEVAGEAAYLLEPNLKDSRGGLRDGQAVRALASAQLVDYPVWVREAYPVLLDVRGELQRQTGRADDVLHMQDQDGVAAALGLTDLTDPTGPGTEPAGGYPRVVVPTVDAPDADLDSRPDEARDQLLRRVNEAARGIALSLDTAWRRAGGGRADQSRRWPFGLRSDRPATERVGLARNVVRQGGEMVLARDADPWVDPGLPLRIARVAAEQDLPIAPFALERLATETGALPTPWPRAALADFLATLGAGRPAITVLESLDQAGLLAPLIPEWAAVRCRAQHNPVHRFTVDRHLLETAAGAAERDAEVERPDLLVLGAFLHDIGKGFPSPDHSVTGAEHVAVMAPRMGLDAADVELVTALVRHHLLLPNTATRRDIDDPMTISIVREAVGDSPELLRLLQVLAAADAAATGPAAWSDWKASLIDRLVRRVLAAIGGGHGSGTERLDDAQVALAEAGDLAVVIDADEVTVAAPDGPGTLSRTTGVLALHSLDVREAAIHTHAGMAINRFVVHPRFGQLPDPADVRADLGRALRGELPLEDRLREKERTYSRKSAGANRRQPRVLWFDDSAEATVVEFRGDDEIGLLSRIAGALERVGLDVRAARVSSLAGTAVDAFYVTDVDGKQIAEDRRPALSLELVSAWASTP